MTKNNGGPAFPNQGYEGLTIRDYFAAKAISIIAPPTDYVGVEATQDSYRKWSEKAYKMADAMLEARNK